MTAIGNLVQQTTKSVGAGNLTLDVAKGFVTFPAQFGTGATPDVFFYYIIDPTNGAWERGSGSCPNGTALSRDTVTTSSNANAHVVFAAGTKFVVNDLPAELQARTDQVIASITGLNTNNDDPLNPVVEISVDGDTITGSGTPEDPLVANIPAVPVVSVFGRTGAVAAQDGDYTTTEVTEGTNLYFTNARAVTALAATVATLVPYTGAASDVDLGAHAITAVRYLADSSSISTLKTQGTSTAFGANLPLSLQSKAAGRSVFMQFYDTSQDAYVGLIGGNRLALGCSTEAMAAFTTGNVAIGQTTDNGNKLQVNGTAFFAGQISTAANIGFSFDVGNFTYTNNSVQLALTLGVGVNSAMQFISHSNTSGEVRYGSLISQGWTSGTQAASPDVNLSRISSGILAVGNGTAGNASGTMKLTALVASKIYPPSDSTTALQILKADGATTIITIDTSNGRLGVGLTPTQKIHTNGNVYSNGGNFLVDNNGSFGLKCSANGNGLFFNASNNLQIDSAVLLGLGGAPVSTLTIPLNPTASGNFGLISLGAGGFAGGGGANFSGSANGTLIAINKTTAADILRVFQNGASGVDTFRIDGSGGIPLIGGGVAAINSNGSANFANAKFNILTTGFTGIVTAGNNPTVALHVGASTAGQNARIEATVGANNQAALTTGNWTLGTGWQYLTGPNSIDKNANGTGTVTPTAATNIVAGTTYLVTIVVSAQSTDVANYTLGGVQGKTLSAVGTFTDYITALTTAKLIITPNQTTRITLTTISVQPLTSGTGDIDVLGNVHAYGGIADPNDTVCLSFSNGVTYAAGAMKANTTLEVASIATFDCNNGLGSATFVQIGQSNGTPIVYMKLTGSGNGTALRSNLSLGSDWGIQSSYDTNVNQGVSLYVSGTKSGTSSNFAQLSYASGQDFRTYTAIGFRSCEGASSNQIYGATSVGPTLGATPWVGFTPTAWLHLTGGTTAMASLRVASGVAPTSPNDGDIWYDGTTPFFRQGSSTKSILAATSGASAPATSVGVAIVNYYGTSATNFLADPISWAAMIINGTTYKVPLYT